jgi:hypothetical protein
MRVREKRSLGSPLWLLFDLIVVFLGVFAAVLLDNYQTTQKQKEKINTIYQFFLEECKRESTAIKEEKFVFDTIAEGFFTAYQEKKMPALIGVPSFFTTSMNTRVWEAVLASGGTQLMDFKTIRMIDEYQAAKLNLLDLFNKGEQYAMEFLLVNMERPTWEFYNYYTGRLKPQYAWYPKFLKALQHQYQKLDEQNDLLQSYLKQQLETE